MVSSAFSARIWNAGYSLALAQVCRTPVVVGVQVLNQRVVVGFQRRQQIHAGLIRNRRGRDVGLEIHRRGGNLGSAPPLTNRSPTGIAEYGSCDLDRRRAPGVHGAPRSHEGLELSVCAGVGRHWWRRATRHTPGGPAEYDAAAPLDGSKVAYRTIRGGRQELWQRSTSGEGERPVASSAGAVRTSPRWSRDGMRLAYMRRDGDGSAAAGARVAIMAVGGGAEELLDLPPDTEVVPDDWSSDGLWILGACRGRPGSRWARASFRAPAMRPRFPRGGGRSFQEPAVPALLTRRTLDQFHGGR